MHPFNIGELFTPNLNRQVCSLSLHSLSIFGRTLYYNISTSFIVFKEHNEYNCSTLLDLQDFSLRFTHCCGNKPKHLEEGWKATNQLENIKLVQLLQNCIDLGLTKTNNEYVNTSYY